jgi:hypothetical protein
MKLTIGHCYSTLGKMTLSQMNRLKLTDCHSLAVSEQGNLEVHIANTSTPDNLCRCRLQADYQWMQAIYCTKQTVLEYFLPVIIFHPFGLQSGSNGAMKNTTLNITALKLDSRLDFTPCIFSTPLSGS